MATKAVKKNKKPVEKSAVLSTGAETTGIKNSHSRGRVRASKAQTGESRDLTSPTGRSLRAKKKIVSEENKIEEEAKTEIEATQDDSIKTQADTLDTELKSKKPERYFEAVGRRKTAGARVRLFTRPGDFLVNGKLYSLYFSTPELIKIVEDALQKMKLLGRFKVSVKTSGGGVHAQAEALRHGLARCLVKFNPDFRKRLKRAGYLTRDSRMKERKKFGLKKARKAPQWAKR